MFFFFGNTNFMNWLKAENTVSSVSSAGKSQLVLWAFRDKTSYLCGIERATQRPLAVIDNTRQDSGGLEPNGTDYTTECKKLNEYNRIQGF